MSAEEDLLENARERELRKLLDLDSMEDFTLSEAWQHEWGEGAFIEPDFDPFELEARQHVDLSGMGLSLSQFTELAFRMPRTDGQPGHDPFSFVGRRHLIRPYDTSSKRILLVCGRQVEKSTLLGNRTIAMSCMVPNFRTLYVSPTATQTKTFSRDRLNEPIETSEVLRAYTSRAQMMNIFEKQFSNWSKIVLRNAYLNADRTRGIPAWQLLIDEFQDVLSENVPVMEQCTSHAPENWKTFVYAGTPKSRDNTIEYYRSGQSKGRIMSTMSEWMVPCDACGSNAKGAAGRFWNILGEQNIGLKGLICANCGGLINPQHADAQWATQVADGIFESFRIPQLMVPWRKWDEILLDYARYPREKFYNEVLGISYDSGIRPLNLSDIQIVCDPEIKMDLESLAPFMHMDEPIYAGCDWGCHDEETRILTERGFVYFRDLTDDDRVAQWDATTRAMTFVKPKVRTVRDWNGDLLHFKTRGGLDMLLTPTHRMRVGVSQGESWLTESAGEVHARGGNVKFVGHVTWTGEERPTFTLPGQPSSPGYQGAAARDLPMDEWLALLGFLITEGGVCLREGRPYCVKMSQRQTVNPDTTKEIAGLLRRLELAHSTFPNPKTGDVNWTLHGKQLWAWYAENIGVRSEDKRVPRALLSLSPRQLKILFDAMIAGDGHVDPREGCTSGAFYSTSKGLCEDVQEICIRLGMRCVVRQHKPADGNKQATWRALWSAGRDHQFNTPSSSVETVPYRGKVYCCAVPTGYIVTERHGSIAYQGNTGENTYTVLTLGTYIRNRFTIIFAHRFVGAELEFDAQMQKIMEFVNKFRVLIIGTDYGGGFHQNNTLTRFLGPQRVAKFQYLGKAKRKVEYDVALRRFKVYRTEVMSDFIHAIKRKQIWFPNWAEFKDPYAADMTNLSAEYNERLRMIQYGHSPDKPDDTFHSALYCFLASMIRRPRPDIIAPLRENPNTGLVLNTYTGPTDQSTIRTPGMY